MVSLNSAMELLLTSCTDLKHLLVFHSVETCHTSLPELFHVRFRSKIIYFKLLVGFTSNHVY